MFKPSKQSKSALKDAIQAQTQETGKQKQGSFVEVPHRDSSYYKYPTLDISLKLRMFGPQKRPCWGLPASQTEEAATTSLLSESQKDPQPHQHLGSSLSLLKPRQYLRIAQENCQQITPFNGGEELPLQSYLINQEEGQQKANRRPERLARRRHCSIPTDLGRADSQDREAKQGSAVRISQIAFSSYLLPQEKCFDGTKAWRQAFDSRWRQRGSGSITRKSLSLSLCQIAKEAAACDSVQLAIKKLAPLGKARSNLLPLKVEDRAAGFINAPPRRFKLGHRKERIESRSALLAPLRRKQQRTGLKGKVKTEQPQLKKQYKLNVSSIFRKLNAFKRKYTVFQTALEDDCDQRQQNLSINLQKVEKQPVQCSKKLTETRYKLMKTGFKFSRASSLTRHSISIRK